MNILQASVLGVVQGITEFLPVSSSGHLILVPYIFHWDDPGLAFDVALHMGTLAALLVFFWKEWVRIVQDTLKTLQGGKPTNPVRLSHLIIGTIPGAIAGLLLEKKAESAFRDPRMIGATLALFGIILWFFDRSGRKNRGLDTLSLKDAAIVGCAQALAILPGVSRSGSTITAALALGLTRPAAARFSFLLCAPIIAGAGVLKMKHILMGLHSSPEMAMAITSGFLASTVSGLLAIGLLQSIIKSRSFNSFVVYRVIAGVAIILMPLWAH